MHVYFTGNIYSAEMRLCMITFARFMAQIHDVILFIIIISIIINLVHALPMRDHLTSL